MKKKLSAVLSFVLALALLLSVMPFAAFSASQESESDKLVDMFYKDVVDEYYDDVYAVIYQSIVKAGLIDAAVAKIDALIAELEDAKAQLPEDVPEEIPEEIPEDWPEEIPEDWMDQIPQDILDKIPEDVLQDLLDKYGKPSEQSATYSLRASGTNASSDYVEYATYLIALNNELNLALDTLYEVKAILLGDELTTYEGLVESYDYLKVMLPERIERIELLWVLLAEDPDSNIDPQQVLDAIEMMENVEYTLENNVIPAIDAALEAIAAAAYDPACLLLGFFLDEEITTAEELVEAFGIVSGMSEEEIKAQLKARIEELIYNATHADYPIDKNSYYVAFGNIHSRGSYADLLANELDVPFKNHSKTDLTIEKLAQTLSDYQDDIAKADLITLNFGEVDTFLEVVNNVLASNANYELDWEAYLGQDLAQIKNRLDAELAKLYAQLTDNGIDGKLAKAFVTAVEVYLYNCIVYGINMNQVVADIQAINPNALIVVVGAYNPISNVTYNYNGTSINIGAYADYLFDVFGLFDLTYAVVTGDITYVNAPDVETVVSVNDLANDLIGMSVTSLMPSADGNVYIKDQILNALNVFTCEHQYGEWIETKSADCTNPGEESRTCSLCGDVQVRPTPALDHDWHWIIDKPASETETGLKHEECSRCHEKRNEGTEIPALEIPKLGSSLPTKTVMIFVISCAAMVAVGGVSLITRKRFF